jgi:sortase A
MEDGRSVDELSLDELEVIVEERRRVERARRFAQDDPRGFRPVTVAPIPQKKEKKPRGRRERILLAVEIVAVVALAAVIIGSLVNLQELNSQVVQAQKTFLRPVGPTQDAGKALLPGSSIPPPEAADELPASSAPPAALPSALGVSIARSVSLPLPTPGPRSPTRIVIPSIQVDWPIVEGDGWEELKAAVGHRISTANPGERGNLVLSGHNDVYGEVFKDLDKLQTGDTITVYAAGHAYRYTVQAKRIVVPSDLSPLSSTREPVVTLITCTPYRIDTHRLIIIAQLTP